MVVDEFNKNAQQAADNELVVVDTMNAIIPIHQHALNVEEIVKVAKQRERRFVLKPLPLHHSTPSPSCTLSSGMPDER